MNDHRSSSTPFAEFDEFDHLLEDEPVAPAPRKQGSTKSKAAANEPKAAPKKRMRSEINPDWNRIGAVGFLVVIVLLVLWFVVTSVVNSRRDNSYRDYFKQTRDIATQSAAQGSELRAILNDADAGDRAQRIQRIEQLSGRAQKLSTQAQNLKVPNQLKDAQLWLVTSLDYRSSGLSSLQRSLTTALEAKADKDKSTALVSESLARFVASDVVWGDSFAKAGRDVLKKDQVKNITVPDSSFLEDLDAVGPTSIAKMLERLRLASKADASGSVAVPNDGKVRGGQLESGKVTVSPSGQTLSTSSLTEIKSGADLAFDVPFTNQGEVQLTDVPVTVTLRPETGKPIELNGTIDVVDPGQTASAKVALSDTPEFGVPMTMDVLVGPIPGEKMTENNRASYQVQFSL